MGRAGLGIGPFRSSISMRRAGRRLRYGARSSTGRGRSGGRRAGRAQRSRESFNGQGTRRRAHPRHDARAVGTHLHAAPRLVRRGRAQGRAARRRRRDPRPAPGHPRRGQPLLHDAEPQQAQHHPQHQDRARQGDLHPPRRGVRRAGGELRPRRARSHGVLLGADPGDQPAHRLCIGQGLRAGPLPGLQGLRERGAVHRRLGEHHRIRRRPAAGDRRPDRRLRHRSPPRAGDRHRTLPSGEERARAARRVRDAGRGAEPVPGEDARSAASRPRAAEGVSAVSERHVRGPPRRVRGTRPAAGSPAGW